MNDPPRLSPDDLLLRFLADREAPCPVCRYNLRSITVPRCPECGVPLQLQVGAAGLRLLLLFAAFAPTLLILGIAAFFGVMGVLHGPPRGQLGFYFVLLAGLLNTGIFAALVRLRVKFLLASAAQQRRITAALWIWNVIVFLSAVLAVR